MSVSKTSVQSVDLDDLERQLRVVAASSLPKKTADPLGELVKAPIDVIEPLMEAGEAAPKEVEELGVGHAADRSVDP